MNDLNALILCGGKSSRLGYDKLYLQKEGKPIGQWWNENLSQFCHDVYYSCNSELQAKFLLDPAIIDEEEHQGPLGGICTYIKNIPDSPILLVAIDLIFIKEENIMQLIQGRDKTKDASCFLDSDLERIYPLFAILETSIFKSCLDEYETERKSLYSVLKKSNLNLISKNVNFNGINTPIELERYLALQKMK